MGKEKSDLFWLMHVYKIYTMKAELFQYETAFVELFDSC